MPVTPTIYNRLSGKSKKDAVDYTVTWREKGFDSLYIYMMVYEWLADNGWHSRADEEFPEIAYIHRDFGAVWGVEIWAYWRMKRPIEGTAPGFAFEHMDINFHFLNLKPHEIVYKGKKIKTQKGEIEIRVISYLVFDELNDRMKFAKVLVLN